jgi:hypothetical protein
MAYVDLENHYIGLVLCPVIWVLFFEQTLLILSAAILSLQHPGFRYFVLCSPHGCVVVYGNCLACGEGPRFWSQVSKSRNDNPVQ